MILKILGSNSDGNSYVLKSNNGETLLIEAGIKAIDIKEACAFEIGAIKGLLLSHVHR